MNPLAIIPVQQQASTDSLAEWGGSDLNQTFQNEVEKNRQTLRNMGCLLETDLAKAQVSLHLPASSAMAAQDGMALEM